MVGDAGGPIMFDGYFTFPSAGRLLVTYQDEPGVRDAPRQSRAATRERQLP
jgi:hypothetical protein